MIDKIKSFYKTYKKAVLFLVKFFGLYALLTLLYGYYLDQYPDFIDPVSAVVSEQSNSVIQWVRPEVYLEYHDDYPRVDMKYYDYTYQYIIEGCNAVSVMILFVAFVFAFKASAVHYLWFIPGGLIILHFFNILRISLLGLSYLYYPEYARSLHDYAFPGVIYGVTMVLWFVWVKYIAK